MKKSATILSKKEFETQLDKSKLAQLIQHFDSIYFCENLSEHEKNIIYLAYLWKNKRVHNEGDGFIFIDDSIRDVSDIDFELTFEVEESGGTNLNITYDYYYFDDLMKIV